MDSAGTDGVFFAPCATEKQEPRNDRDGGNTDPDPRSVSYEQLDACNRVHEAKSNGINDKQVPDVPEKRVTSSNETHRFRRTASPIAAQDDGATCDQPE